MAVPRNKTSNTRSRTRRAHDFLVPKQLSICPKCSTPVPTHIICPTCGRYMGRTIVDMEAGEPKGETT